MLRMGLSWHLGVHEGHGEPTERPETMGFAAVVSPAMYTTVYERKSLHSRPYRVAGAPGKTWNHAPGCSSINSSTASLEDGRD